MKVEMSSLVTSSAVPADQTYIIEQAYIMFDMNVVGLVFRGVSTTNT